MASYLYKHSHFQNNPQKRVLMFSQSLPDHPQLEIDLAWKCSLADKPVQPLYSCHKADSSLYGHDCTFPTESPMGKAGNKRNPDGIRPAEQGSSCLLLRRLTWQPPPAHPIEPCPLSKASLKDLHSLLKPELPIPPALCHDTAEFALSWWLQLHVWSRARSLLWRGRGEPLSNATAWHEGLSSPAQFLLLHKGSRQQVKDICTGALCLHTNSNPITAMPSWVLKRLQENDG